MFSTWDASAMSVLGTAPDLTMIHKVPHCPSKVIMKSDGFHVGKVHKDTIHIVCDASDTVVGFTTPGGSPMISLLARKKRRNLNNRELEAIRRALVWAFDNHPQSNIQIWTDSSYNAYTSMKDSSVLIKMIAEHWMKTRSHVGIKNIACASHSSEYNAEHEHFSVVQHWALDKVLRAANRGESIASEEEAMNIIKQGIVI